LADLTLPPCAAEFNLILADRINPLLGLLLEPLQPGIFARNLQVKVPKASQDMVAAALRSVFAQQEATAVAAQWDQVITMLIEKFPAAAALMAQAKEDGLAFRTFPAEQWRKIWSTNPLERLNKEIKRRTRVVGISPNHAAIIRLVGALLLEQQDEWQLEGCRVFSALSMAQLDSSNDPGQVQLIAALTAAAWRPDSDQVISIVMFNTTGDAAFATCTHAHWGRQVV
jgi:hypothetical protein